MEGLEATSLGKNSVTEACILFYIISSCLPQSMNRSIKIDRETEKTENAKNHFYSFTTILLHLFSQTVISFFQFGISI